jgi:hypothetical protein
MTSRWRLPGPGRLAGELADALSAGRSSVLLVPEADVTDGLETVLSRVVARHWRRVDLGELAGRVGTLSQRLHDYFGLSGNSLSADVAALVDAPELRGHAIWLEPGGPADAAPLGAFLRDFSRRAAERPERERPVLMCCARLSDVDPLPVSDAALHRTWWWGTVGPLDTRVVADAAMGRPRVIGDLDVVAETAGFDLALADQLARRYSGHLAADLSGLVDEAHFAAWRAVPDTVRTVSEQAIDEPPDALRAEWSAGCVDWWGDRVVAHVGCVLPHGPEGLRHLAWRGQVGAVMPFVEIGRQRLARWVHDRRDMVTDGWDQRDLLALEAGQLHKVIRDHEKLRRTTAAFQFATALREARHKLAHLEPLEREWLRRNEPKIRATTL